MRKSVCFLFVLFFLIEFCGCVSDRMELVSPFGSEQNAKEIYLSDADYLSSGSDIFDLLGYKNSPYLTETTAQKKVPANLLGNGEIRFKFNISNHNDSEITKDCIAEDSILFRYFIGKQALLKFGGESKISRLLTS